jgi:hypothetical protein
MMPSRPRDMKRSADHYRIGLVCLCNTRHLELSKVEFMTIYHFLFSKLHLYLVNDGHIQYR